MAATAGLMPAAGDLRDRLSIDAKSSVQAAITDRGGILGCARSRRDRAAPVRRAV